MNNVNLTGRWVADPEVVEIGDKKKGRGRIAVQQTKEKASFFEVIYWANSAEMFGEYAKKGGPASVSGYLDQETWDDKTSGQKRDKIVIVCNKFDFPITDRNSTPSDTASKPAPNKSTPQVQADPEDDFPF